jgi:hypothetical protein
MAYIPEAHKKYNLLPYCTENGGEVFEYPSIMADEIENLMPESVMPYGYESYSEYYFKLDEYISKYGMKNGKHNKRRLNKLGKMILHFKELMQKINGKESWSVVRYIGKSTGGAGLTHGRYYYLTSICEHTKTAGIIDDEEFTSYAYSFTSENWEIAEDPEGISAKLLEKG